MKVHLNILIFFLLTSCLPSEKQKLTRINLKNGIYTIGELNDGVKDGKWFTILEKMKDTLSIEYFNKGVLEHQTVIMSDGLRWEETMSMGKRNGPYNLFQNGLRIESGNNVNDTLDGYRIFYRPDGTVSEKYNYQKGVPEEFFSFYEDGKIRVRSTFFGRDPHIYLDTSGVELFRIIFREDQIDTIYNSQTSPSM